MRNTLRNVSLFVCLFGALTCYADAQANTQTGPDSASSDIEIATLRAQLQTMQNYDQRLLSTVFWSLGIVVAITILLGGFSWYTNFRLYERDREALRQDLNMQVQKALSTLSDKAAESDKELRNTLSAFEERSYERNSKQTEELECKIKDASQELRESQQRDMHWLEIHFYDFVGDYHEANKSVHMTYVARKKQLEAAFGWTRNGGWLVEDALEALKRSIKAGKKLDAGEFAELSTLVAKLPEKYAGEVEPTLALFRSARS